jgi:soluble P-type ATPase
MIEIEIPGAERLRLAHLVLDYNGTLALDGHLLEGVAPRLRALADELRIVVVTADTFGRARAELGDLPCEVIVLEPGNEGRAKAECVRSLGADTTVAIGNGRNDEKMLAEAALGVAVVLTEGAAGSALRAADLVFTRITDALDALLHPKRLVAGLRS